MLGGVLLTPFPDPYIDSGVVSPNVIVLIGYPPICGSKKSTQPIHVTNVVVRKLPFRMFYDLAFPRRMAVYCCQILAA
jgi:hypothetical protein